MHLTASHVCRSLVTLRLGSDEVIWLLNKVIMSVVVSRGKPPTTSQ
jgi:hypothetical protein